MIQQVGTLGLTAIFSVLATLMLVPLADKIGLLDRPDDRKTHKGAVPLVGGIGLYIAISLTASLVLDLPHTFLVLLSICGIVTLLGALDDRYNISASLRLSIQLGAGIAAAYFAGIELSSFGNLFGNGDITLGLWSIPITAIAVAGLTNAFNMADGIDGLSGTLAFVSISGLVILTYGQIGAVESLFLSLYCVAITVFLLFNLGLLGRKAPKVFLGDAGSMFLGSTIALALIFYSQNTEIQEQVIKPSTALWLVAVPMFDMVSTMLRRMLKGQSPLNADRTHLHHILMRAGLNHRQTLVAICLLAMTFAAAGIIIELVWPQNEPASFIGFMAMFAAYYHFVGRHAFVLSKYLRRSPLIRFFATEENKSSTPSTLCNPPIINRLFE